MVCSDFFKGKVVIYPFFLDILVFEVARVAVEYSLVQLN